jgi:hypothetical protein
MLLNLKAGRFLPAILLTLICAGCASNGAVPVERDLPEAPAALVQPVAPPALHKGDDPRVRLAQTRQALFLANSRLTAMSGWYESVRESYGVK